MRQRLIVGEATLIAARLGARIHRGFGQERAAARRDTQRRPERIGFVRIRVTDVDDAQRVQAFEGDATSDLGRRHRLDRGPLRPALNQPRQARRARVRTHVAGDRFPRHPAPVAQLLQRLEHQVAHAADRAGFARALRHAHDLAVRSRLVPSAAAAPGVEQRSAERDHLVRAGG